VKNMIFTAAVFACLLGLSIPAFADNGDAAPKGWLLVRSGAANTDANYDKEDSDSNGKLENVSVLCQGVTENAGNIAALINTDKTRTWGATWGVSAVSTVLGQGGSVTIDSMGKKNPNHCLINGLTLGKIKGIWH
jgi:hypothetical protein